MKLNYIPLILLIIIAQFSGCNKEITVSEKIETDTDNGITQNLIVFENRIPPEIFFNDYGEFVIFLERIAEVERAGAYIQGLGIAESVRREEAGDFGGAVFAAYKDLSRAYGTGAMSKAEYDDGLARLMILKDDSQPVVVPSIKNAALAIEAFANGSWNDALAWFACSAPLVNEPDSFYEWMILASALESGSRGYNNRSAYGSIRGRYTNFPEYWYRGARTLNGETRLIYAEYCINLNPAGPFAEECRDIMADFIGIESGGRALRTMGEIEEIVTESVSVNNPAMLSMLFPLISLPDNSYTLYALGAMRSLASVPLFRAYFENEIPRSGGRLRERLVYVSRGL